MENIMRSDKLKYVHSDIRGPVFVEALKMEKEGTKVLKLNTGNPATFGFGMPDSVKNALLENTDRAVAYCDLRGMPAAREAIYEYHKKKGIEKRREILAKNEEECDAIKAQLAELAKTNVQKELEVSKLEKQVKDLLEKVAKAQDEIDAKAAEYEELGNSERLNELQRLLAGSETK